MVSTTAAVPEAPHTIDTYRFIEKAVQVSAALVTACARLLLHNSAE